MAYVSKNYAHNPNARRGTWVGAAPYYGECVSYVKAVTPGLPSTAHWGKGELVKGNAAIVSGTVIATFNAAGHYHGHAAIYVSQDKQGVSVWDQWIVAPPKAIGPRVLRFGAHGQSNNGDDFYVVQ